MCVLAPETSFQGALKPVWIAFTFIGLDDKATGVFWKAVSLFWAVFALSSLSPASDCFQMCLCEMKFQCIWFCSSQFFLFADIFLLFICFFIFFLFLHSKCKESQVFCLNYGFKTRKMRRLFFSNKYLCFITSFHICMFLVKWFSELKGSCSSMLLHAPLYHLFSVLWDMSGMSTV